MKDRKPLNHLRSYLIMLAVFGAILLASLAPGLTARTHSFLLSWGIGGAIGAGILCLCELAYRWFTSQSRR